MYIFYISLFLCLLAILNEIKLSDSVHASFPLFYFFIFDYCVFILKARIDSLQGNFRYPVMAFCPFKTVLEVLPVSKFWDRSKYNKLFSKLSFIFYFKCNLILIGNINDWMIGMRIEGVIQ